MDRTKDSATEQNVGGSGSVWEVKVQPEVEEGGELNTGALGRFCATRAAGGGSDRLLDFACFVFSVRLRYRAPS